MCEKQNGRTKASVHMCDPVIHTYITHSTECEAALSFPSNRMEIQTSGIMDEGWTSAGMKARSYTTEPLCTYRSRSCIFSVDRNKSSVLFITSCSWSIFKWCRHRFFCYPEQLCEEFLYGSSVMCLSPSFSSSFLPSFPSMLCPISLPPSIFCLCHSSIHPLL